MLLIIMRETLPVLLTLFIGPPKASIIKVDFITFSCLLGLSHSDRTTTELTEYEDLALEEYQHMYLDGHTADGQTVFLKPYFYVLNNILRQILYLKVGDSTFLRYDS